MIDSGATRTVVRAGEPFLAGLPTRNAQIKLVTADNTAMTANKLVDLPIRFTNQAKSLISTIIVENLASPIILGLDFIKDLTFSSDSIFVHLNGNHLRLVDPSVSVKSIRALNKLELEPYAISCIDPKIPHNLIGTFFVEGQSNLRNPDFEVIPTVYSSTHPSQIFVKNKTGKVITIRKSERIAIANQIELNCNAIVEVTNVEREEEEVENFQAEREERAENLKFEPVIKSYGSLEGDDLDNIKQLVMEQRLSFQIDDQDLGKCGHFRFTVPLLDESDTAHQPPRPVPIGLKPLVASELQKWKALGMIRETQSGFNIPLLILRKPDGSIRVSLDARLINTKLVQDRFPLPAIPDVFAKVSERIKSSDNCFISTVDFARSYNQIQIAENDCHKIAFSHEGRHLESSRLLYGLSTAPGGFSRIMAKLFGENPSFISYMDDLIVVDSDLEDHKKNLRTLFETCRKYGLVLNGKKVVLCASSLDFLGHTINKKGIFPLSKHMLNIRMFERPTSRSSLKRFLGMCNFQLKFFPKLGLTLDPLNRLLSKEFPTFCWTDKAEQAFVAVKEMLTECTGLAHFDRNLSLWLVNDASGHGLGSTLYQLNKNDEFEPIGYHSRPFKGPDLKRSIREKELMAIASGCQHFSYYLMGRKFNVVTDHKSLLYLYREHLGSALDLKLTNIFILLQNYDFTIVHRPGTSPLLASADYLSRLPGTTLNQIEQEYQTSDVPEFIFNIDIFPEKGKEMLNDQSEHRRLYLERLMQSLKPKPEENKEKLFINFDTNRISKTELVTLQSECPSLRNIFVKLEQKSKGTIKKFKINDDSLLVRIDQNTSRPVLSGKLAQEFISFTHCEFGHPGIHQTMRLVSKCCFIVNLKKHVTDFLGRCLTCLRSKPMAALKGALQSNRVFTDIPFRKTSIDLYDLGKPDAQNKRYVLSMKCELTCYYDGVTLSNKTDKLVSNGLLELILRYGVTGKILSDNGREFGPLTKALFKKFAIEHVLTSAYNSRGNSLVERSHRTITQKLKVLGATRRNWSSHFPLVKFYLNNLPSKALNNLSPAECLYGRSLLMPLIDTQYVQPLSSEGPYSQAISNYISKLHPSLAAYHYKRYSTALEGNNAKSLNLKVGDRALIWKPVLTDGKLSKVWDGPYVIVKKLGQCSFVLADPSKRQKFRRHARHLRPIKEREPFEDSERNLESEQNLEKGNLDYTEFSKEFDPTIEYPYKWTEIPTPLGGIQTPE